MASIAGRTLRFILEPPVNMKKEDRIIGNFQNMTYKVLSKKGGIRAVGIIKEVFPLEG